MTADNDAATTANLRQEWEQCVRQLLEGPSGKDAVLTLLQRFQLFKRMLTDELISVQSEQLDDIATTDLPFLLVDVHLGECWLQMPCNDILQDNSTSSPYSPRVRLEYLEASRKSFETFLLNCELVCALRLPEDQKWWQQWKQSSSSPIPPVSREEKIRRFRHSKSLKGQIKVLDDNIGGLSEEQARQRNLLSIQLAIQQAQEQLEMIKQEGELLRSKLAADQQQLDRPQSSSNTADDDSRLDMISRMRVSGPLLSKDGKVLRPFVITKTREQLAKEVFRPGHLLPTMSIDEYLKQEYERGNVLQGGTGAKKEKLTDGEDEEQDENVIYKKREWDNFKDENPRGWGNQKVNRG